VPNIFVDDEVYQVLQSRAIPFIDKEPNDVLRRDYLPSNGSTLHAAIVSTVAPPQPLYPSNGDLATGLVRRRRAGKRRPSDGTYTSQEVFWKPILKILVEIGGRGNVGDVLERLAHEVDLTKGDYETLRSGSVLWENRAQWARQNMVNQGLLQSDSPRGVWEITGKGHNFLAGGS
jgi:hypothetical protein